MQLEYYSAYASFVCVGWNDDIMYVQQQVLSLDCLSFYAVQG